MIPSDGHRFGDLIIHIDRTLCVGFGDCVDMAPVVFQLDDEDIAIFDLRGEITRDALLEACRSCPVDAITVWDEDHRQIVP